MSRDTNYSVLFNQLLEVDGPFLTAVVAKRALGKILEKTEQDIVDEMRVANEERAADDALTPRWIRWVFDRLLHFDDEVLKEGPPIAHMSHLVGQHGVTLRPDLAVIDPEADGTKPLMLITEWAPDQQLDRKAGTDHWNASPTARMVELCQALKVPLGLVTNGRAWTLVYAPVDDAVSTCTWDAELWLDERETLDLFSALIDAERFFGVDETETLAALLAESADSGEEVTTTLGRQVRKSVELLVSALSEANRERNLELFEHLSEDPAIDDRREVYRGAVTVMMRLVFLLSAEERGLFLLGDETYDSHYAVSTLLNQLESEIDHDVLFTRHDAWPRLLATFRLIHGGVQHDDRLNLPAYGGELFDPERFPFLEGRARGEPLDSLSFDDRLLKAINNRVVMAILQSLQYVELKGETRRLSFRHLDVEQIGTVYEGLLDHTCTVVSETTLGLLAKKSSKGNVEPEIALAQLEAKLAEGRPALEKWLKDEHKFNATELRKLDVVPEGVELTRLRSACGNDEELTQRVTPFIGVLRSDLRDLPEVFLPDSYVVVSSTDRSDTGAHYTPRSIAEEIVTHALDPLVYEPGPHNEADPANWQLRPWEEIVDLKIVDPACGSGAMLVSACRYLADRLVEAWDEQRVERGIGLSLPGAEGAPLVVPGEDEQLTVTAMRLVAGRSLYGVDVNDMAVEMCKLSLWLATLAKGKPFSFVDHAIRHGDSLFGLVGLDELAQIGADKSGTGSLLVERLRFFVDSATAKRIDLLAMPTVDARDLDEKDRLLAEADQTMAVVTSVADAVSGARLSTADLRVDDQATRATTLAEQVTNLFHEGDRKPDAAAVSDLTERALYWLDVGRPELTPARVPFHWPLAFPEVFMKGRGRFDAAVSNPPFLGGQKLSGQFGENYRKLLIAQLAREKKGSADLVAYFLLRAAEIARFTGYVATNTVGQGDTSEVGLEQLIDRGSIIHRAVSSATWPGDASVEVSLVWLSTEHWETAVDLDGIGIHAIDEMLYRRSPLGWRKRALVANGEHSFIGSYVLGMGFTMSPEEAQALIDKDRRNRNVLFPYLGGEDLNRSPTLEAPRWIINFFDWSAEEAGSYPDCFQIVEEQVKPGRLTNTYSAHAREHWWQYERVRPELYRRLEPLDRCLAICQTSKVQQPVFVRTGLVLAHKIVVFPYDDDFHFGLLTSGFHWRWVIRYGSTMRKDPVYTPSDVFETFPQPDYAPAVEAAGHDLDEHRSARMVAAGEGLTETYNRVHDPHDRTLAIVRLRELHVELDRAVAEAYGWADLDLDHGFHPVRGQGIRYTLSPDAAVEVLYRLLELNRVRYEEEVAAGLHRKKSGSNEATIEPTSGTLF